MLIKTPAITPETRKVINDYLKDVFVHKEGVGLDAVVSEVLGDKDVFLYLSTFFPRNHGIELGSMSYWDDIRVSVPYGLAINERGDCPICSLFTYHMIYGNMSDLEFQRNFPTSYDSIRYENVPTPEHFARLVNLALQSPKDRKVIDLSKIQKSLAGLTTS